MIRSAGALRRGDGAVITQRAPGGMAEAKVADEDMTRWVWPRKFSPDIMMRILGPSIISGHLTNHGPCAQKLESQATERLNITKHQVIACSNGCAALHALVATYKMSGYDLSKGILVSAFGFPPIMQQNWGNYIMTDIDPVHAGPVLPTDGTVPSAICVVNPFGFRVDCAYYRRYCDEHNIPLWMDNAACPYHVMPDGSNLSDMADASIISLHETKAIGRGEGGLLLVKPEMAKTAFRAINFGYDPEVPPADRADSWHLEAANWRMSDIAAAAILMSWELNFDTITKYHAEHDHEISDIGMFKRGCKGSLYSCKMEPRQEFPDKNFEIKRYYYPLCGRDKAPVAWEFYDGIQCRPFHPPGGPCPYDGRWDAAEATRNYADER